MIIRNMKPRKKYFIGGFLVLVLAIGVFLMLQNRELEVNFDENGVLVVPEKEWFESQTQFNKKLVDLFDRLEEMKAQDDFGGETPQETFDAFVEALKAGDTDLASRYFVFNKQEQMAEELAIGKENGNLDLLIGDLERVIDGRFYFGRDDKYEFVVIGNSGEWNGIVEFSYNLVRNPDTKVWKIESL